MLDRGMKPEDILNEVLGEFDPEILDTVPLSYRCTCSRERVERAIRSLAVKELRQMIQDGRPVEVGCQFCDRKYEISLDELKQMAAQKIASRYRVLDGTGEA